MFPTLFPTLFYLILQNAPWLDMFLGFFLLILVAMMSFDSKGNRPLRRYGFIYVEEARQIWVSMDKPSSIRV